MHMALERSTGVLSHLSLPQAFTGVLRRPGRSSAAAWGRRCLARAGSPPTGIERTLALDGAAERPVQPQELPQ